METVTSRANERVKEIQRLCTDAAARTEKGLCVLFGEKLCLEALRLGVALAEVWFTEDAQEKSPREIERLIGAAGNAVLMSGSVDEKLSYQKTPQGVFAVARLPKRDASDAPARSVILDGVQDPANVGAIIRSAAALGWTEVTLSEGSADAFSPKALRASMGAAFAVRVAYCESAAEKIKALREKGVACMATALSKGSVPITDTNRAGKIALVIGNEGNGLSDETIAACDLSVIIPISAAVESLNAAAASAVAMWELRE